MPVAKDPSRAEFFVYYLEADGVPFYVGVGRSARASDRARYVRYLMRREAAGKPVKWTLHTRVIATLLRAGCNVRPTYPSCGLVREAALVQERAEISALLAKGYVLANVQHNPQRPESPEQITEAVLAQCCRIIHDNSFTPTPLPHSA
jgi:hypothetical protein